MEHGFCILHIQPDTAYEQHICKYYDGVLLLLEDFGQCENMSN